MHPNYLDFEQPIAELEAKIEELRYVGDDTEVNIGDEISKLEEKSRSLTQTIFSKLDAWQTSKLARHPMRPYTLDYIDRIFTDFQQLHGDRAFSDDAALVGGLARLDGMPVMVIGHQKGRDTKENIRRNFGMPRPEGYRKALRLMKLAERFRILLLHSLIHRVLILELTLKSAINPKPLRVIFLKWQICKRRLFAQL